MRKIIIFSLLLFLADFTFAQKVLVMSGVTPPPKKAEKLNIPVPSDLTIDDEMLPKADSIYLFHICFYGKRPILVEEQQERRQPVDTKAANTSYRIKKYEHIRDCKTYHGPDTPKFRNYMYYDFSRKTHIQNAESHTINKSFLGKKATPFFVEDKALMPYTIAYDEMPIGSILKKILVDSAKIKKFYSFNVLPSNRLGELMQERLDNNLPVRITFYEEIIPNGLARNYVVFVFNDGRKYAYTPNEAITPSDTVYDIIPDFAVQYTKKL